MYSWIGPVVYLNRIKMIGYLCQGNLGKRYEMCVLHINIHKIIVILSKKEFNNQKHRILVCKYAVNISQFFSSVIVSSINGQGGRDGSYI